MFAGVYIVHYPPPFSRVYTQKDAYFSRSPRILSNFPLLPFPFLKSFFPPTSFFPNSYLTPIPYYFPSYIPLWLYVYSNVFFYLYFFFLLLISPFPVALFPFPPAHKPFRSLLAMVISFPPCRECNIFCNIYI